MGYYMIIQQDGNREEASERQLPAWLEMPAQRGPGPSAALELGWNCSCKGRTKKQRHSSFYEAKASRCSRTVSS